MAESEQSERDWMVEQAIPEDAEKIAQLHSESFQKAYLEPDDEEHNQAVINEATQFLAPERIQMRAELLTHALNNPELHFYQIAMRDDGQPIGLIYGTKLDGIQEIEALYVDENYYGSGVGKALVEEFIDWSDKTKPIELGVYVKNERAKKFYTKMGFEAMNDDRHSFYEFLPETTMKRKGDAAHMEQESRKEFTIEEMTVDDIDRTTEMRKQSWLDTYLNEEHDVTKEWVDARFVPQLSDENYPDRVKRFVENKANGVFNAWTVKAEDGKIIGAATPFIDKEGHQRVGSMYVDKDWHGKGVGTLLMQKVIDWLDPSKPIELGVVTYNERAKAFYRKWGFEEVPGSEDLYDNKLPEIKMIRPAKKILEEQ